MKIKKNNSQQPLLSTRRHFVKKGLLFGAGLYTFSHLAACSDSDADPSPTLLKSEPPVSTTATTSIEMIPAREATSPNAVSAINSIQTTAASTLSNTNLSLSRHLNCRFCPPKDKIVLCIGQTPANLGGQGNASWPKDDPTLYPTDLNDPLNDGYLDHNTINPGAFHICVAAHRGVYGGLKATAALPRLANSALFLSFDWMGGFNIPENKKLNKDLLNGVYDAQIDQWALWCKTQNRPIYMRTGAEINRIPGFYYDPSDYKKIFRKIVLRFRELGVNNVVFGFTTTNHNNYAAPFFQKDLADYYHFDLWYPGDDVVDWLGYSMFNPYDSDTLVMAYARKAQKPVILAESSPLRIDIGQNLYYPYYIAVSRKINANDMWNLWWQPMIDFVKANIDVVIGWSYIYNDWHVDEEWRNIPVYANCDGRIHLNHELHERWQDVVTHSGLFITGQADTFQMLGYPSN